MTLHQSSMVRAERARIAGRLEEQARVIRLTFKEPGRFNREQLEIALLDLGRWATVLAAELRKE